MADQQIGIALILSAYDRMNNVINGATNKAMAKMKQVQDASAKMAEGWANIMAAKKGIDLLEKTTDAYGDMQEAGNYLKATLMGQGGIYDPGMYEKLFKYSQHLSDSYTGSTASYIDMIRVMKQNRLDPKDVMGGIGEAAAKLSIYFDNMLPAATAEFAAHMRNDMGVAANQMYGVMDLTARVHDAGVGKTGEEAVMEMNQFFSKVGLGLANLHVQGLEAAKQMGAVGTIFMAKGISGQSVGTNFRRILDGIASGEKVKKANQVAAMFHKHLDFFDKNGKFLGVENFVKQLGKLQGLNPTAIEAILKPFSGKQGLSTDFMEFLANDGTGAYGAMKKKIENQASLNQKVGVIMAGQKKQSQVLASTWENTKAAFGKTLSPALTGILQLFNKVSVALRNFIDTHPKLAQFIGTFIAIASAAGMLMGVIKIIQGIRMVMQLLNITMMANPFMLIAIASIAAVSLIITYWDPIKGFFERLWGHIKNIWNAVSGWFSKMWQTVKSVFTTFTKWAFKYIIPVFNPTILIFQHWSKIKVFFHNLWASAKKIFMEAVNWFGTLDTKFYNAGKTMVEMIWKGIKNMAHKPVEAIKNMVHKIRQYLPFSPAKEGPLKDIHRIKLVETIAESIKPTALINAWHRTLSAFSNVLHQPGQMMQLQGGGGNGGAQIVISPTIHLNGSATKADADMLTDSMRKMLDKWYKDTIGNKQRVSY